MTRISLVVLTAAVALSSGAASPAFAVPDGQRTCKFGAVYQTESGRKIIVKRLGFGRSSFQKNGSGPKQQGIALDFVVADGGDRGQIFGPMRSYMFVTDLSTLAQLGFQWQAAPADPDGFYRVMDDDGEQEMFTFTYVRCAPNASAG